MSKVYFIDFHTTSSQNILAKLKMLLSQGGISDIDFSKKLVALKIHFGEPGNLAYLRPNYVSVIANFIKAKGGVPFLTDTNTLYSGHRSNAVDHLQSASENGFSPLTTGCNVIIADGLKGTEYKEIEINLKHCKTAKIAAAISSADIIVTVNHFKCHDMAGFGGALKNLGMGSGSVGGKLEMHSDSQPFLNRENCIGCGDCVDNCAYDAIHLDDKNVAVIDGKKCSGCGQCIAVCQYDATQARFNSVYLLEKMMEYAFAASKGKNVYHINFIMDVSPNCDCWHYNDIPIVEDIGILSSFDPVALDKASADLVNQAPVINKSIIGARGNNEFDRFKAVFPNVNWMAGIEYAEKIGLGSKNYKIIQVK